MLTDVKVAKAKYEKLESAGEKNKGKLLLNRLADRDGLYLAVSPPHKDNKGTTYGSKVWRYASLRRKAGRARPPRPSHYRPLLSPSRSFQIRTYAHA
jgi:hypothetical protein